MDIKSIIRATRAYNFHSHTQFCDGHDTLEAIARAAADLGYLHFGFSPHSPVPIESPCNMALGDLSAYRSEIDRMRHEMNGRMQIYLGVEIDYLGPLWGPAHPMFHDGTFDYAIGSVHFIPSQEGAWVDIDGRFEHFKERMELHFHNDIRYVVETFFRQTHSMLDEGGFDIIGHFDKIAQNASCFRPGIETEAWFAKLVDECIDHVVASGCIVEINTKAREQHGRFFPHERHWKHLIDAGATLMVNSDAHFADRIESARAEAFEILDSLQTNDSSPR